ncbi:hypothetical protein [Kitasatospora sp. McL0602]|uniref:hypothetical protein n=1 Tax=Kitasatospora sp. McL0602 TaxID=3439530 RepID=UPI003F8962B0
MTAADFRAPRALRVRADGAELPLHPEPDGRDELSGVDLAQLLSAELADDLRAWAAGHPPDDARRFTRRGYELASRVAAELGPSWVVLCRDEVRGVENSVCWDCGGFHWRRYAHEPLVGSRAVRLKLEFRCYPVRFVGGEQDGVDFAPDDPVVALGLTDELVDRLYAWSTEFDELFDNRYWLAPEEERRLAGQGRRLARELTDELGSGWTVEYDAPGD